MKSRWDRQLLLFFITLALLASGIVVGNPGTPTEGTPTGHSDPKPDPPHIQFIQDTLETLLIGIPGFVLGINAALLLSPRLKHRGHGLVPPRLTSALYSGPRHGESWRSLLRQSLRQHILIGGVLGYVWVLAAVEFVAFNGVPQSVSYLRDVFVLALLFAVITTLAFILVVGSADAEILKESLVTAGLYFGTLMVVTQVWFFIVDSGYDRVASLSLIAVVIVLPFAYLITSRWSWNLEST